MSHHTEMAGIVGNSTGGFEDGGHEGPGDNQDDVTNSVVKYVLLAFSAFVAVFGNGATIVAFLYDRGLREKPSNMLILALSCSDLCVGLIITSGTLGTFLSSNWHLGEIGCRIFVSIGDLIVPLGPLLVAAICLDRYLLVSRDYPRYLAIQTRRSVNLTIALCWMLTAVLCVTENILWNLSPANADIDYTIYCLSPNTNNLQYNQFSNIVYVLIPFTFVTGCSVRFLVLLRKKLRGHRRVGPRTISARVRWTLATRQHPSTEFLSQMSVGKTNEPSTLIARRDDTSSETRLSPPFHAFDSPDVDTRSQLLRSRYIRPTITVICLVAALAVCYLPYCIYFLFIVSFCPTCSSPNLFATFHLLRLFNSCLDPILYAATQRRIRAFYGKHLRRIGRLTRSAIRQRFQT